MTVDQMGVELGKVLAKNILAQLGKPEDVTGHDSSVCRLRAFLLPLLTARPPDHRPHPLLPEAPQGVSGVKHVVRKPVIIGLRCWRPIDFLAYLQTWCSDERVKHEARTQRKQLNRGCS
jgi:hypothetical protein